MSSGCSPVYQNSRDSYTKTCAKDANYMRLFTPCEDIKRESSRVQSTLMSQGVRCGVGVADGKENSNSEHHNIKDNKTKG